MTSKELVDHCMKTTYCANCEYEIFCDAYLMQFGCYPTDHKYGTNLNGRPIPQEAYSNETIHLPDYIVQPIQLRSETIQNIQTIKENL